MTKPFSLEEVAARLRGLLRRTSRAVSDDGLLVVGDLTLDEESHEVTRGGDDIRLTATEFELLRYLMRNPKRVLSKAQILDRVWEYDFGGQGNIVELYISYLRRKIDAGRVADDPHDARRRVPDQARDLTAGPGPGARPVRSRRPLSLRARLLWAFLVPLVLVLAVVGFAATTALRAEQLGQVDSQLATAVDRSAARRSRTRRRPSPAHPSRPAPTS